MQGRSGRDGGQGGPSGPPGPPGEEVLSCPAGSHGSVIIAKEAHLPMADFDTKCLANIRIQANAGQEQMTLRLSTPVACTAHSNAPPPRPPPMKARNWSCARIEVAATRILQNQVRKSKSGSLQARSKRSNKCRTKRACQTENMSSFPKLCALCYQTYSRLKQHLQCAHTVQNSAELALLIKYGNARSSGPLDCPICSRQGLVRLDKHLLSGHQIMSAAEREPMMLQARRLAIAREFKDLRATDPYPPMVSTLGALSDLDDDGAVDLTVEFPAPSTSSSDEQACQVVHPDSSGQPVQPPTPLKSTWHISLEKEDMEEEEGVQEEEEGVQEGEEEAVVLAEEEGIDMAVVEEVEIVEEEVEEEGATALVEEEQQHGPTTSGPPSSPSTATTQSGWETPLGTASAALSSAGAATATLGQWSRTPSTPMASQSRCQRYSSQTKDGNNSNPSSCCNCKCLELVKRVEALEATLKKMSKEAPAAARTPMSSARTSSDLQSTTAKKRARQEPLQKTPQSAFKGDQVVKGGMKGTLYEKAIGDLQEFKLSGRSGRKAIDNAKQVATHCFRFCYYMVGSLPESATKHDLRFLARMDKLRRYPNYLKNKGYMPTTIRNMAINIVSLYKHVKNVFLEESRLKVEDIDRVLYELTRLQAEIRRDVVVRQQRVKRQKTNNQLDSEQELSFLYAARRRIPMLMDAIDKGGHQKDEHSTLMGYLMGYLCVISGHRSVVLTNMTKEHVANADQWNNGTRFQVLVDEHKSVRTFGQASLVLNCIEFSWLRWFHDGKCCSRGKDSANIFHTFQGCKLSKPSRFLHLAWSDAGLKGPVSFTLIRSSVATQAERHLSETERRKVARAMCHDPTTAERFYVALPTRETAYENRKLRMKALMCEKRKAKAKRKSKVCDEGEASYSLSSESSEDGDEPVYDDEPDSSSLSSSSSEEVSIRSQRRPPLKRKLFGPVPSTPPKQKPEGDFMSTVATSTPSKIQVTLQRVDNNNQHCLKQPKLRSRVFCKIPKREWGVPQRLRPKGPSAQPVAHVDPCQRWGISVRGAENEVNISEVQGGSLNVVVHSPGTSPNPRVRPQPPAENSPDVSHNPPSARQPELLLNTGPNRDLATDPPVVQGFDPGSGQQLNPSQCGAGANDPPPEYTCCLYSSQQCPTSPTRTDESPKLEISQDSKPGEGNQPKKATKKSDQGPTSSTRTDESPKLEISQDSKPGEGNQPKKATKKSDKGPTSPTRTDESPKLEMSSDSKPGEGNQPMKATKNSDQGPTSPTPTDESPKLEMSQDSKPREGNQPKKATKKSD
ncbi:hypothetical protein PAMA_005597 [Pampus argenteus]